MKESVKDLSEESFNYIIPYKCSFTKTYQLVDSYNTSTSCLCIDVEMNNLEIIKVIIVGTFHEQGIMTSFRD